jgi:hypothetical protein
VPIPPWEESTIPPWEVWRITPLLLPGTGRQSLSVSGGKSLTASSWEGSSFLPERSGQYLPCVLLGGVLNPSPAFSWEGLPIPP